MNRYKKIVTAESIPAFFRNAVSAYRDFHLFEHCGQPADSMTYCEVYA